MSLSEISIRRPVFAWMLMSALIIFGGISFLRMGIGLLPDVDFPVINISLSLPGAAPQVMETDVVDVVENAVMTIQGVKRVTSSARNGSANVSIELDLSRDVDLALQDVQSKIAEAQRKLPKEMDPAVISKTNPEDQPIMWIAVRSDKHSPRDLALYVRDHVQDQFTTVPDVGDINLGGYIDPNLRIWVDGDKLAQHEMTVSDLVQTVQREHLEPPAGWVDEKQKEYNVRTMGEATSAAGFEKLMINTRGGAPNFSPIPLSRVATVEEGLADVRRLSRSNGKSAIGLGIRKQRGANAVEVANVVNAKVDKLSKSLPPGMELAINFDSTGFIREAVSELNFTVLLSAILTALVCWFFLGSWSSTFNILMAIPTSIVGTFIFLHFAGFTLNTFTLLGLALAIGIVVDDAIMVLENIIRHREMGKSRVDAALDGSKEITFAALAATISIVAIFVPVIFMKGPIGRFFFQFGVTMTVAVCLSLVEALTLTPMRCAQFVEGGERTTRFGKAIEQLLHRLSALYSRLLAVCLAHRWKVVAGSLLFFALSFFVAKELKKEFSPAQDQSRFMVRVKTPIGSAIDFTDEKMRQLEDFLKTRPEILRYYAAIGGFGGGEVNTAMMFVTMKPKGERGIDPVLGHEISQQESMEICRKAFNKVDGVKAVLQDLSSRGFSASRGFPLEFVVKGRDWEKLGEYSAQMMDELEKTKMVTDLDSDYLVGMPEIQIIPDRVKAAARGVSVAAIGETVNALIGGVIVGQYPEGGHRYDIRLKLRDDGKDRMSRIKSLNVYNNRGQLIPLSDVVSIQEKATLQTINRENRERAITVFGNIADGASQEKAMQEVVRVAQRLLPEGYHVELSGSAEAFKESFGGLYFAFILGLVVAYMVLASQFNSFVDPMSVLMALPFSISGGFLGLWIGGQSLNMYSLIGFILLMGIVKKNSILLVDFTNHIRNSGVSDVRTALLKACPIRLRPILMTSIATIVGAVPAALALGPGSETRAPMAMAVIGGVAVSTLLTLFVVPCTYSLLSFFQRDAKKA